ncbi:TPA: hypothetical protein MYK22_001023 [Klebsiella pneumoniae]|uniref:hypothetical protein n=1 Tax=Klebsiella pneumoniae TaxID=573 RepID=UPI0035A24A1A|nr:hypothetical protein [Klebsiella pneumoniae]HDH0899188.1 hypothetical protein [Klebsiella pneumoniae]
MNNLEKMEKIGRMVFGANWITPMSKILGIDNSTIRRWLTGKSRVSSTIAGDIAPALEQLLQKAIAVANSDKVAGDDITDEMLAEIADRYTYSDEQHRKAAIDEMNNAVFPVTYLSNLESIALKWSRV